jgi:endonuclease
MRLVVARCEVVYTGRLNAVLPEALRLLMLKDDGSVMVHADSGGFKPQNWMTPPTVIEEGPGRAGLPRASERRKTANGASAYA